MNNAQTVSITDVISSFGEEITDSAEETFFLFSSPCPSNNLGILSKASSVTIPIGGNDYTIHQSSGLLTSARGGGTTGAVLWKVTPLLAEWLSGSNTLWKSGILHPTAHVVELGCGVAGLIGSSIASRVGAYLLTDQRYVMKLLRDNIAENENLSSTQRTGRKKDQAKTKANLDTLVFDWETDSVASIYGHFFPSGRADETSEIDLVVLCDCIYNDYLIDPLAQTCREICAFQSRRRTMLLIAQQLRTDEVFEAWMGALMERGFRVWRIRDEELAEGLRVGSGYAVHLAVLN